MKMSELIDHVGDENIEIENLDHSFERAKSKPTGTKVTFNTKQLMTCKGFDKVGIVVWMDRQAVKDAVEAQQAKEQKAAE